MSKANYDLITAELKSAERVINNCMNGMVWNTQSHIYCPISEAEHNVKYLKSIVEDYCEAYLRTTQERRKHLEEPDILGMLKDIKKISIH